MNIAPNLPFDYLYLMNELKDFASPRDKVTQLLKSGDIIRIKKGLYLPGTAQGENQKEIIAGMLYGPSYISLEYALMHYKMIPEQVKTVTCITTQKPKLYTTPAGSFRYQHIRRELFHLGLEHHLTGQTGFWLASKEKALCDLVYYLGKSLSVDEIETLLLDNMRIETTELQSLDLPKLEGWLTIYHYLSMENLYKYLRGITL
jgi:predicted transcriptional regulator of viral defense system